MNQLRTAAIAGITGMLIGAGLTAAILWPSARPRLASQPPKPAPVVLSAPPQQVEPEIDPPVPPERKLTWEGSLSPLMSAAHKGNAAEVRKLIEDGYDIDELSRDGQGETPLHWAAHSGGDRGLDAARLLIAAGAAVNTRNDYLGATPLAVAAANNNPKLVRYLISRGAEVNAVDNRGRTPLDFAEHFRYADIISILKAAGAKPGSGKF